MERVSWEPRAVEKCPGGIKVHAGPVVDGMQEALEIAKKIFLSLGDRGIWYATKEIVKNPTG